MIRLSPFLVLAALASIAPAAQTSFTPDPGVYLVVENVDPIAIGDSQVGLDGVVGWRFASGWDAGLALDLGLTDFARRHGNQAFGAERRVGVGVTVGATRALGERSGLRADAGVALGRTVVDRQPTQLSLTGRAVGDETRSLNGNDARVSATIGAFRRVPVGRVVVQPTLRASASGTVSTATTPGRGFTLRADADRGLTAWSSVRLGVAVPISARVVGRLVTVETQVSVDVERGTPDTFLRLRLN
ncbi:hypothetical protein [Rubrivirga sp. IMCC45206]|uniref:hypothetical protein n=1 Tax=Rubrivirga sp. IMCC45206 TaxID=3391614 RepID=UPI00398FA06A